MLIFMTVDAKTHIQLTHLLNPVHFLHITMATAAIDLSVDMYGMVEEYKIWNIPDLHPFDGLSGSEMCPELLNFRMMYNYFLVAKHARLQRRNARTFCLHGSVMAHEAAYIFLCRMYPVTEMNRLLRSSSRQEIIPGQPNPRK